MSYRSEQLAGEAEGSGDHEREPEAAGAGVQNTLQSECISFHTEQQQNRTSYITMFLVDVQEEMARLQQNIEELKMASGHDTEEEKVHVHFSFCFVAA